MGTMTGKVAMITGSGGEGGFGRAIARRFAAEGADLVLTDIAPTVTKVEWTKPATGWGGLEAAADEVRAAGRRALTAILDVRSAITIDRSDASNASYGTMLGCALPRRIGGRPVVNAFCAWFTKSDSVDPSSETSTRRALGRPVPSVRSSSAASTATHPWRPATTSETATPTLLGCPASVSGKPVIDIRPPTAWATKS